MRFALSALFQQKVRTLLTVLGVVIGAFVLSMSLSIGQGVEEVAMRQLRRNDQLRKIEVMPGYGDRDSGIPPEELQVKGSMSDAKRQRLRDGLIRRWNFRRGRKVKVPLTRERLDQLAALPHVDTAVPRLYFHGRAVYRGKEQDVSTAAMAPGSPGLHKRLVAGRVFSAQDGHEVVVSELLLYEWGVTDDADVEQVIGQPVRLDLHFGGAAPGLLLTLLNARSANLSGEQERVLEKAVKQLPAALDRMDLTQQERATLQHLLKKPARPPRLSKEVRLAEEFVIAGVLRGPSKEEEDEFSFGSYLERQSLEADVILPLQAGEQLYAQVPNFAEHGFDQVTVTVDDEANVKAVTQQIGDMGLGRFSLVEIVENIRVNMLLISLATSFVAAVALLVAALGITNTMLMSVLERTREIGVMKAVGARDGHIQLIFLLEGALIGLVGGCLGLLAGWAASFPGDAVAHRIVERQTGAKLEETLFAFPLWLTLGIPAFAVLVTTLAAVYPARRAARVNPIAALRHE
jgi:putative ABC transport system permease protein